MEECGAGRDTGSLGGSSDDQRGQRLCSLGEDKYSVKDEA